MLMNILLFSIFYFSNCQINILNPLVIRQLVPTNRYTCVALSDNGTTMVAGAFTYIFHLLKYNISNKITGIGVYYFSDQTSPYRYLYFINGYLLAFSTANPPRIFNEKTFDFVGNFNYEGVFSRGKLI